MFGLTREVRVLIPVSPVAEEVPQGTWYGEEKDEVPVGTWHGSDEVPSGTWHGSDEVPAGTWH